MEVNFRGVLSLPVWVPHCFLPQMLIHHKVILSKKSKQVCRCESGSCDGAHMQTCCHDIYTRILNKRNSKLRSRAWCVSGVWATTFHGGYCFVVKMTCAENTPSSLRKQDGLCTQGLYCRNQSWEIETGGGVCENVSASWFDTLKKKGWKKLPLDWKMEIDVGCWLFFFYVHPYARMGTLRRSNTKAKTEETHAGEGAPEFS